MNLEEIKVNEELKKFAEKYNWELEVWHGEYIDFQTEFL